MNTSINHKFHYLLWGLQGCILHGLVCMGTKTVDIQDGSKVDRYNLQNYIGNNCQFPSHYCILNRHKFIKRNIEHYFKRGSIAPKRAVFSRDLGVYESTHSGNFPDKTTEKENIQFPNIWGNFWKLSWLPSTHKIISWSLIW